jgi:hypothetical protein
MILIQWRTDRRIDIDRLAKDIDQPDLRDLISAFLSERVDCNHDLPNCASDSDDDWAPKNPDFNASISVFPSAVAGFFAPSDVCGTGGMRTERIHAIPSWRGGPSRYDPVFVRRNNEGQRGGLRDRDIARVRLFFSFTFLHVSYSCALVHEFKLVNDAPDEDSGMWIVDRRLVGGRPRARVIPLDSIERAAHLIPVYGYQEAFLPKALTPSTSLDDFEHYYVNRFADHHSFEIAS